MDDRYTSEGGVAQQQQQQQRRRTRDRTLFITHPNTNDAKNGSSTLTTAPFLPVYLLSPLSSLAAAHMQDWSKESDHEDEDEDDEAHVEIKKGPSSDKMASKEVVYAHACCVRASESLPSRQGAERDEAAQGWPDFVLNSKDGLASLQQNKQRQQQ